MSKRKEAQQAGAPKKKGKKKWIVIGIVVIILVAAAVSGGNNKTDEGNAIPSSTEATEAPETSTGSTESEKAEAAEYKLEHGDLVSAIVNEIEGQNVLVVKAKISSSYNNKSTVDQNYYNVEDLIQNQGCAEFDEIQYWAVSDMSDGTESKVISFTLDAELIRKIAEKSVAANQLGDYVADLYILPSLAE
ncbi:hypothetical protein [Eisenbergiella sp.]